MTEGARRHCRLALTRKNTKTNDELQLALFSSNDWSEESRQVKPAMLGISGVPPVSWTPNPLGEWRIRCQEQDELIHPSFASR